MILKEIQKIQEQHLSSKISHLQEINQLEKNKINTSENWLYYEIL